MPPIVSLLFKAFKISFNNLNMALSVEEFDLKPHCSFDKMLLLVKFCGSLVNINFTETLEKEGNEDIGL
jgi:hypothetical protein